MFRSMVELDIALKASSYIADPVTVSTVYLAATLHKPLLLEGVAGAGKTQLAYAVATPLKPPLSGCSAIRASTRQRRLANSTNRCSGFVRN